MEAVSIYPGSCGEVIQGKIQGKDMLTSCPVNIFTKVRLFECKNPENRNNFAKSSALLENMLKRWGFGSLNKTMDFQIESQIPGSKGFASSTADLCALYICLLKLFKRQYRLEEAIEEFIRIEPTDSTIFREMTLFDYKEGKTYKNLGEYTKFYILAFEGRRIVDTLAFNKADLPELSCIDDIMPWTLKALETGNIIDLARASTISIQRNFNRLPYDIYTEVEKLCIDTGGLGIMGAHSGDVLGIIYDDMERFYHIKKSHMKIKGYEPYMLETLRRYEYERDYDYSTWQWQRKDNDNCGNIKGHVKPWV